MPKKLNKAQLLEKAAGYKIEVPEGATNKEIETLISDFEAANPGNVKKAPKTIKVEGVTGLPKTKKKAAPAPFTKSAKVNGIAYTFKQKTPRKLQINGEVRSLDEIISDADAFTALVVGNNPFVEKVRPPKKEDKPSKT